MTFQPVFPPLVLMGIAAIIVVVRIAALRRLPAARRTRAALWRWGGLTLAALLLVVAAARPVIDPDQTGATRVADREAPNVFLVVDRSPDMRVVDYPTRQVQDGRRPRGPRGSDRPLSGSPRRSDLVCVATECGLAALG